MLNKLYLGIYFFLQTIYNNFISILTLTSEIIFKVLDLIKIIFRKMSNVYLLVGSGGREGYPP